MGSLRLEEEMMCGCLGSLWGAIIMLWRRQVSTRMHCLLDELARLVDSVCSGAFH